MKIDGRLPKLDLKKVIRMPPHLIEALEVIKAPGNNDAYGKEFQVPHDILVNWAKTPGGPEYAHPAKVSVLIAKGMFACGDVGYTVRPVRCVRYHNCFRFVVFLSSMHLYDITARCFLTYYTPPGYQHDPNEFFSLPWLGTPITPVKEEKPAEAVLFGEEEPTPKKRPLTGPKSYHAKRVSLVA